MKRLNKLPFTIATALVFLFPSSCKKSGSDARFTETDDGEELVLSYEEKKPEAPTPFGSRADIDSVTLGGQETCEETSLLYNGFCLDTQDFYIWSNETASKISDRSSGSCLASDPCDELDGYTEIESFKAIVEAPDAALDSLYPIYNLKNSTAQMLTVSQTQKSFLLEDGTYEDHGTLFYVASGNSASNSHLARFINPNDGSIKYQIGFNDIEGYKLDSNIGGIIK